MMLTMPILSRHSDIWKNTADKLKGLVIPQTSVNERTEHFSRKPMNSHATTINTAQKHMRFRSGGSIKQQTALISTSNHVLTIET